MEALLNIIIVIQNPSAMWMVKIQQEIRHVNLFFSEIAKKKRCPLIFLWQHQVAKRPSQGSWVKMHPWNGIWSMLLALFLGHKSNMEPKNPRPVDSFFLFQGDHEIKFHGVRGWGCKHFKRKTLLFEKLNVSNSNCASSCFHSGWWTTEFVTQNDDSDAN